MQEKNILDIQKENLGDCEIDLISFIWKSVRINIYDPYEERVLIVNFDEVEFFLFESNHVQNVIQSVTIYKGIEEVMNDAKVSKFILLRGLKGEIEEGLRMGDNMKIAYISPITGGDTLLVFKDLTYYITKA